ncbi:Nucleic acid-binding, OB-fold [Sesbania bispinosa]|nr:Nucleic acid-binding, OB-fold [Sesbania bispinosa]
MSFIVYKEVAWTTESELISVFGLDVKISEQIEEKNGESYYLLGMGVFKCSLFGHFIDLMKGFLTNGCDELAIVVIQFARVKKYRGKVSIYTVGNSTRILWNPQIAEAIAFKDRYRLRLEVSDSTEKAEFVVFDYDATSLLAKSCTTMIDEFPFKLKGPLLEEVANGDGDGLPESAGLSELFIENICAVGPLGESSNAAACLAPQKCKA